MQYSRQPVGLIVVSGPRPPVGLVKVNGSHFTLRCICHAVWNEYNGLNWEGVWSVGCRELKNLKPRASTR